MAREGAHPNNGADPGQEELAAMRAQLWYPEVDGILFDEALRCFEQGAYRAALVMTWLSIAEGLRYRLVMAARRDLELTALLEEITRREKEGQPTDSFLLDKARKHELIGVHEHRDLAHIRDQRNHYAHPRGESPSRAQVLAALDAAVRIVVPSGSARQGVDRCPGQASRDRPDVLPQRSRRPACLRPEIDPLLPEKPASTSSGRRSMNWTSLPLTLLAATWPARSPSWPARSWSGIPT
jgi:hypothetical protein